MIAFPGFKLPGTSRPAASKALLAVLFILAPWPLYICCRTSFLGAAFAGSLVGLLAGGLELDLVDR